MTLAADYSDARPSPADLAARGVKAVGRYLAPSTNLKAVTRAEIDQLHRAGIDVWFFYETTATMAENPAHGASDAADANNLADSLGVPGDVWIYYAVDDNSPNLDNVSAYFGNVLTVGRRPVAVYGSTAVIERVIADHPQVRGGDKVETWGGPSVHAVLEQLANSNPVGLSGVDSQLELVKNFGQWAAQANPTVSASGEHMDIYWRNDVTGPGGAWPVRIMQGSRLLYDATGAQSTLGFPADYLGFYNSQSDAVKATMSPILANATIWNALTVPDSPSADPAALPVGKISGTVTFV